MQNRKKTSSEMSGQSSPCDSSQSSTKSHSEGSGCKQPRKKTKLHKNNSLRKIEQKPPQPQRPQEEQAGQKEQAAIAGGDLDADSDSDEPWEWNWREAAESSGSEADGQAGGSREETEEETEVAAEMMKHMLPDDRRKLQRKLQRCASFMCGSRDLGLLVASYVLIEPWRDTVNFLSRLHSECARLLPFLPNEEPESEVVPLMKLGLFQDSAGVMQDLRARMLLEWAAGLLKEGAWHEYCTSGFRLTIQVVFETFSRFSAKQLQKLYEIHCFHDVDYSIRELQKRFHDFDHDIEESQKNEFGSYIAALKSTLCQMSLTEKIFR
eukprot:g19129.t1